MLRRLVTRGVRAALVPIRLLVTVAALVLGLVLLAASQQLNGDKGDGGGGGGGGPGGGSTRMSILRTLLDLSGLVPQVPDRSCRHCNTFDAETLPEEVSWCGPAVEPDPFLLVLVTSLPAHQEARATIRDTWGSVRRVGGRGVKVLFVLGLQSDRKLQEQLAKEQEQYGDLLTVGLRESYNALTRKTLAALTWAVRRCPRVRFLLKTDDDCFNNLPLFVDFLAIWMRGSHHDRDDLEVVPRSGEAAGAQPLKPGELDTPPRTGTGNDRGVDFVGGFCFTTRPTRDAKSKWRVGRDEYPDVYFPVYCGGPAYVLSLPAAAKIVAVAPDVRFFRMEDIFVTGFCRTAAGIDYVHIPGVLSPTGTVYNHCQLNTSVLNIHQVPPQRLRTLWQEATRTPTAGPPCPLLLDRDHCPWRLRVALFLIILLAMAALTVVLRR